VGAFWSVWVLFFCVWVWVLGGEGVVYMHGWVWDSEWGECGFRGGGIDGAFPPCLYGTSEGKGLTRPPLSPSLCAIR
jgi:hypothetical protein